MQADLMTESVPHLDVIAKQAFEVLAGMAPEYSVACDNKLNRDEVEAWVAYDGGEKTLGTLLITANTTFAMQFSQGFLGLPTLSKLDDDVLDAMGELANTVGGNFKGLFSADTTLSIPVVSTGNRDFVLPQASATLAGLAYSFQGGGLCRIWLLGPILGRV